MAVAGSRLQPIFSDRRTNKTASTFLCHAYFGSPRDAALVEAIEGSLKQNGSQRSWQPRRSPLFSQYERYHMRFLCRLVLHIGVFFKVEKDGEVTKRTTTNPGCLVFCPPRQGLGIRLRQSRLLHEEFQSASHSISCRSVGVVEGVFFESARFMISAVGSTVPFSFRVDH
jgi:hypothetical protein